MLTRRALKNLFLKLRHKVRVARGKWHEARKKKTRSPQWPSVEKRFLNLNPYCAACGSTRELQVHHVKPFHLFPKLELQPDNLLTLCMDEKDCHLMVGHGGYFAAYNPNVLQDVADLQAGLMRGVVEIRAKRARLK